MYDCIRLTRGWDAAIIVLLGYGKHIYQACAHFGSPVQTDTSANHFHGLLSLGRPNIRQGKNPDQGSGSREAHKKRRGA